MAKQLYKIIGYNITDAKTGNTLEPNKRVLNLIAESEKQLKEFVAEWENQYQIKHKRKVKANVTYRTIPVKNK